MSTVSGTQTTQYGDHSGVKALEKNQGYQEAKNIFTVARKLEALVTDMDINNALDKMQELRVIGEVQIVKALGQKQFIHNDLALAMAGHIAKTFNSANIQTNTEVKKQLMHLLRLFLELGHYKYTCNREDDPYALPPLNPDVAAEIRRAYESITTYKNSEPVLMLEARCVEAVFLALQQEKPMDGWLKDIITSIAADTPITALLRVAKDAHSRQVPSWFADVQYVAWFSRLLMEFGQKPDPLQEKDYQQLKLDFFKFIGRGTSSDKQRGYCQPLSEMCISDDVSLYAQAFKQLKAYAQERGRSLSHPSDPWEVRLIAVLMLLSLQDSFHTRNQERLLDVTAVLITVERAEKVKKIQCIFVRAHKMELAQLDSAETEKGVLTGSSPRAIQGSNGVNDSELDSTSSGSPPSTLSNSGSSRSNSHSPERTSTAILSADNLQLSPHADTIAIDMLADCFFAGNTPMTPVVKKRINNEEISTIGCFANENSCKITVDGVLALLRIASHSPEATHMNLSKIVLEDETFEKLITGLKRQLHITTLTVNHALNIDNMSAVTQAVDLINDRNFSTPLVKSERPFTLINTRPEDQNLYDWDFLWDRIDETLDKQSNSTSSLSIVNENKILEINYYIIGMLYFCQHPNPEKLSRLYYNYGNILCDQKESDSIEQAKVQYDIALQLVSQDSLLFYQMAQIYIAFANREEDTRTRKIFYLEAQKWNQKRIDLNPDQTARGQQSYITHMLTHID